MTTIRTCRSCGYRFAAHPGQDYCSTYCERAAAMTAVINGLRAMTERTP